MFWEAVGGCIMMVPFEAERSLALPELTRNLNTRYVVVNSGTAAFQKVLLRRAIGHEKKLSRYLLPLWPLRVPLF
jgi:hypothetical protein